MKYYYPSETPKTLEELKKRLDAIPESCLVKSRVLRFCGVKQGTFDKWTTVENRKEWVRAIKDKYQEIQERLIEGGLIENNGINSGFVKWYLGCAFHMRETNIVINKTEESITDFEQDDNF